MRDQCEELDSAPDPALHGFFAQGLLDLASVTVVYRASVLQAETEFQRASYLVDLPTFQATPIGLAIYVLAGGATPEFAAVVLGDLPQPP